MRTIPANFMPALLADERRVGELTAWTLANSGATIRLANLDFALTCDVGDGAGRTVWQPLPWRRESANFQSDLQVDQVTLTFPNVLLMVQYSAGAEEAALGDLALNGVFEGATAWLYLVNLDNLSAMRHSRWEAVGAPTIDRSVVAVQLQSYLGKGLRKTPRTLLQEGCNNALFDARCGLVEGGYTVTATATGGTRYTLTSALPQAADYFSLGRITFISGPNIGAARTISAHDGLGGLTWPVALRFRVEAGHRFEVIPGCPKTLAACESKFAVDNREHYRGFVYVPRAETPI